MQHPVGTSYPFVVHGPVLEVISVAVLLELLPSCGHQGGCLGEVVFRAQILHVVGVIHLLNIT